MLHAIVPAAGHSRRMGRPKLLLPLGDRGETVISRLLQVLKPEVDRVVIVCRGDDVILANSVRQYGAEVVQPEIDPPDMRTSVGHGLRHLNLTVNDGWLLCPADSPLVEPGVLRQVIAAWNSDSGRIVIPTFQGQRGHPVVFPGSLAAEVFVLPAESGLNVLVRNRADLVREVPFETDSVIADLDTPEDYAKWQERVI